MKIKQIIPIYIVLNGLSMIVPTILVIGFSITLFEKDSSGISAAYLEPASLLGAIFAGLIGGFFFKRFSSYTIGVGAVLCVTSTLLILSVYNGVNLQSCTITLWVLACVMNIEHSNSLAFFSRQIGIDDKAFFLSAFQFFLNCFNILAPIVAKNLLAILGLKTLLLLCSLIYTLRIVPWQLFRSLSAQEMVLQPSGMLTGFKEIIQNPGLLRITSFRFINYMTTTAYTISLPILVARMANGNSQVNAQLYSYSISMMHLGFTISGICGSWILKKKPKWIIYFFNIGPIVITLAVIMVFYVRQPFYLQATALLYGMGLYLLKAAITVIGQALTKKDKLAYVILAGDAMAKLFAYGIGSLMPCWIAFPSIGSISLPCVGFALCSLLSLGMIQPITNIYLASLCKKK